MEEKEKGGEMKGETGADEMLRVVVIMERVVLKEI